MGTLVFQATLGGAVNIIGPNIASTINFTLPSADGTSGQTWTTNGSGVLAFGTLGIAGGGTGQITATAAFNALAPSQTGNSGKYLTTDGTNSSWATNPLGTVTSVGGTGTVNGLTLTGTVTTSGNLTLGGTLSGIANSALTNSSITIGGTAIALGASSNALANDITVYGLTVGRGSGAVSTNTAVGYQALITNSTGSNNTAVGYQVGTKNTTGSSNTAVGVSIMDQGAGVTGSSNIGIGNYSLRPVTSGTQNIGIGVYAVSSNTTGSYNVGVGSTALTYSTTGSNNTAIGDSALFNNTTASNNTAVGYQSGYSTNTGANNAFVGYQAGYGTTSGYQSTAVGAYALKGNVTNLNCVAVGHESLLASTGNSNTAIGQSSGSLITTGQSNTIIGRYTGNQGGLDIRTSSNYIVLSDGDGNPRGFFDGSGRFMVGTVTQRGRFTSEQDGAVNDCAGFNNTGSGTGSQSVASFYRGGTFTGNISNTNATTSYNITSDQRLKQNIQDADSASNLIDALQVRKFDWKSDNAHQRYGFIAQELVTVAPEAVYQPEDTEKMMAVDYSKLVPMLVKEIQSLRQRLSAANL